MSREVLKYLLLMFFVLLKALLNPTGNFINNTWTFFLSDLLNIFSNGCSKTEMYHFFQCLYVIPIILKNGPMVPCFSLMQNASYDSVRVLASLKYPVLRVNMTIQEEVGFIRKPDIIQEFLVIANLFRKPLAHGYPDLQIDLGHMMIDLDPVGITLKIFNQNVPNMRFIYSNFLVTSSQKSGWILADWLLDSGDIFWFFELLSVAR